MLKTMSCPQRLADYFGNPSEASRQITVDRQSVYQWITKGYIPPQQALNVERMTKGEIKIREILEEAELVNPVITKISKLV